MSKIIAITGHTSGIGLALSEYFSKTSQIIGMSRKNGFNINTDVERIVTTAAPAQIFINNAYDLKGNYFAQTEVLFALFERWQNENKTIINIGSHSSNGNKNYLNKYAVSKAALDKACEQMQTIESVCKVINVRFGHIDTSAIAHLQVKKLSTKNVVQWIDFILSQPQDVYVHEVSFGVSGGKK